MAEKPNLGDLISAGRGVKNILDLLNTGMGSTGAGVGLSSYGVPAAHAAQMGAAGAGTLAAAAPFLGLAGFIAPKLLQGLFGEKPKIEFMGTDPKYAYHENTPQSGYAERQVTHSKRGVKSPKYNYSINVEDTGKNNEMTQALISYYDGMFDQMAAQGIPVNDMLDRNKNFVFGGRLDKGMSPEMMDQWITTHFAPDVQAYQSGQAPPQREISVRKTITRDEFDNKVPSRETVTIPGSTSGGGTASDTGGGTGGDIGGETGNGTDNGTGTQGTPQVDTSSPDNFWNEFTNQWFNDENNAKLLFQNHVDFLANEADQYNQTTQTATDDQSKLLDSLTKQYAKPININVGGNDMSWVPRGSRNTITELGQVGQTDMTNQINAGKQRMENAQVRSPSIGGLSYLDALQKILSEERNRNKLVNDLEIAKTGARIDQQRVDQGEPGFWGTAGSVVKGVDGILDLIGRF
jgi:hypothetical protein